MSIPSLKPPVPSLRPVPTKEGTEKRLHEVSEMYEKHFLREMMKAMRGTVPESGLIKANQAEKIFREQLDGEHVENWSKRGGVGLADLIYNQLVERYGEQLGLKGPIERPRGPINLSEKSNFTGRILAKPSSSESNVTFQFDRAEFQKPRGSLSESLADHALTLPWEGVLTNHRRLTDEDQVMEFDHANGLKSRLVYRGVASPGLAKGSMVAGQTLGILSPDAKSFFWTVENRPKSDME